MVLFENKIEDISVFKEVPFKNIEELDLSYNRIKSVEVFLDVFFENLKDLKFGANETLNYSDDKISKIYKKYNIQFTYESLF